MNGLERQRYLIAGLIALTGAVSTAGIVLIAALGRPVPDSLPVLSATALGALVAALTRFPPPAGLRDD